MHTVSLGEVCPYVGPFRARARARAKEDQSGAIIPAEQAQS